MNALRWNWWWLLLPALLLSCNLPSGTVSPPTPSPSAGETAPLPTHPSTTETPVPTPISRLFESLNLASIELLTPTENAGHHPKFEWQPVAGASQYLLLLMDENGVAYWAWQGSKTAVFLGGYDEHPPEDSVGPILLRPMRWTVIAFDAEGKPIASSLIRPIAP